MPLGIRYYFKGVLYTLTHPSLWKYIILQLFIAILLLVGIYASGHNYYQKHVVPANLSKIFQWLSIAGIAIFGLFVYVMLNSIFTQALMKKLSQKVEEIECGQISSYPQKSNIIKAIIYFPFTLAKTFIELIISFIPVIGQWWGFYKVGRESVKGTLERRMDKEKLKSLYTQNHISLVAFGALSTVALIMFPLTLFYLPLRVIGGTLLALEISKI